MVSFSWADWLPPTEEQCPPHVCASSPRPRFDDDSASLKSSTSLPTIAETVDSTVDVMTLVGDDDVDIEVEMLDDVDETPAVATDLKAPTTRRRSKVQFEPMVETREYGLVLGDHPWPDSYPLQLDWGYTEAVLMALQEIPAVHDLRSTTFHKPHRLSSLERRWRLAAVTGRTQVQVDAEERERRKSNSGNALDSLADNSRREDKTYMGHLMHSRTLYDLQGDMVALSLQ